MEEDSDLFRATEKRLPIVPESGSMSAMAVQRTANFACRTLAAARCGIPNRPTAHLKSGVNQAPVVACRPMQGRSLVIEDVRDPQGESHILRLNGPLVLTTVDEFQSRVRAVRSNHLILDMTDVPYVDSAGIGVLVGTYVRHQRDESGLSLVGVNDRVYTVLKIAHVEQFFRFFNSLSEVTAKLAS